MLVAAGIEKTATKFQRNAAKALKPR